MRTFIEGARERARAALQWGWKDADGPGVDGGSRRPRFRHSPRALILTSLVLFLLVLGATAYFSSGAGGETSANGETHFYLTVSIVDRHTLNITPFSYHTADIAYYNGNYYADKAPGLSLFNVPAYVVARQIAFGGRSLLAVEPAQETRYNFRTEEPVRYALTVFSSGLPTAVLAALLFLWFASVGVSLRWSGVLAAIYGLGTCAHAFASEMFSHQLASCLLFGAFALLLWSRTWARRRLWEGVSGVLLGWAFISEYPTAIIIAALLIYALALSERRIATLVAIGLGSLGPLVIGAAYNTKVFGRPWATGYSHLDNSFAAQQAQGFFGIVGPQWDALLQTTVGPFRGLMFWSPVLLLALPGFYFWWKSHKRRAEWYLAVGIACAYFLYSISYFEWDGGWSMGPRQYLPALPFLMLGLGELALPRAATAWKWVIGILGAESIAVVTVAVSVGPLVDEQYRRPLTQWVLPRFLSSTFYDNFGQIIGLTNQWQLLPLFLWIVALVAVMLWVAGRFDATAPVVAPAQADAMLPVRYGPPVGVMRG